MNKHAAFILRLLQDAKGDDAHRCLRAFARYNKEEMQKMHGESGMSRQEHLDRAIAHEAKIIEAMKWVESKA